MDIFRRKASNGEWCCLLIAMCLYMNTRRDESDYEDCSLMWAISGCLAVYSLLWANRLIYNDKTWFKYPVAILMNTFKTKSSDELLGQEEVNYEELMYDSPDILDVIVVILSGFFCGIVVASCLGSMIGVVVSGVFNHVMSHWFAKFHQSFTFGEGCVVLQAILTYLGWSHYKLFLRSPRTELVLDDVTTVEGSFMVIERLGLCSLTLILSIPFLPYCSWARSSTYFFAYTIAFFLAITYPMMWIFLQREPFLWLLNHVLADLNLVMLLGFWLSLVAVTLVVVQLRTTKATTVTRKVFHLLVILVYVSGIWVDRSFTKFCSLLTLALFVVIEYVRAFKIQPLSRKIDEYFVIFTDEKDQGFLILTNIYLLIGTFAPLWMAPANASPLLLMSGVLSVGIGDAAASIVGSQYGRIKWPFSKKTIEGTLASIVSQVLFLLVTKPLFDYDLNYLAVVPVIAAISLMESLTNQVDNIVLPLSMYFLVCVIELAAVA